jgi:acyl-CoA thioester hydrolase
MPHEFRHRRRVEFFETDLAGIVHFSNYLRYMEMAEHDFLRSLGWSVTGAHGGRKIGWPRVHVTCDYRAPLAFEDDVEVQVLVRERRSRSIEYVHVIRKGGGADAPVVAVGRMVAVCVVIDPQTGAFSPAEIPAELATQLEAAPVDAYEQLLRR